MGVDSPSYRCIHQIFEDRAAAAPDAVAIDGAQARLTYAVLNERANRLAHYLQAQGVGPNVFVGICAERSPELIVGLLGVLKAGGAYVPLDPSYPKDRRAFMLRETKAQIVLTQEKHLADWPEADEWFASDAGPCDAPVVVCLDHDWDALFGSYDHGNPTSDVTPDDVAYVTYTSGSTGNPKGALIPHRSIPGFMFGVDYVTFDASQTLLLASSISWDAFSLELWPALLHGGRCVLLPSPIVTPKDLKDAIETYGVTLVWLTSSLFNAVIDTLPDALVGVRQLLIGGEALSVTHVRRALDLLPHTRIVNGYGPSECTVFACCYPIPRPLDEHLRSMPIGRPIGDRRVYILDKKLNRVPIGVTGELYIGGPAVPNGYLNRPELNAESFVPDPFGDEPNAKLYKTGDLVRFRRDGNIEFLGRQDDQIKIRGYRVELGEVETALVAHPIVRDAVVIAREDEQGSKRLVAYVVPKNGQMDVSSQLTAFLKEKLPTHMRPSALLTLDTLPLTSTGKVDRQGLPAPSEFVYGDEESFVAPRTVMEKRLAEVWADVLGVARIGIHDDFFALGGDSILSIQIVSKAGEAGLEFTPKQLFAKPTVAELAEVVDTIVEHKAEQGEVTGIVPLTPIQSWFFERDFAHPEHFNHAVLLHVPTSLDASIIDQALLHLLKHHDALRSRFTKIEGVWQQTITSFHHESLLARIDLSELDEAAKASAIEARSSELQATLNLSDGPLLRAVLFDTGSPSSNRLLIIVHHLVVDIVSWRVLLDQFRSALIQLSSSADVTLPAKTCSYKQYSEELAAYVRSHDLLSQADQWLVDAQTETSQLPTDYPAGDGRNTYGSMATVSCSLGVEETGSLLEDVPSAYNTQVNDLVLSAVVQAIQSWTGSDLLRLDMEGHGRSESIGGTDVSRTVGWFTAMYPVVLDANGAADPEALIKNTKERLRRIPSGGIGYGLLRYLGGDEKLKAELQMSPQAEVSYNYIGHFDQVIPGSALFHMADESFGPLNHPSQIRPHLLTIHALIAEGRFRTDWIYSEHLHNKDTIERVANQFIEALRGLIDHCLSEHAGGYTPSDFALAGLDQEALDRLKSKYETNEDDA